MQKGCFRRYAAKCLTAQNILLFDSTSQMGVRNCKCVCETQDSRDTLFLFFRSSFLLTYLQLVSPRKMCYTYARARAPSRTRTTRKIPKMWSEWEWMNQIQTKKQQFQRIHWFHASKLKILLQPTHTHTHCTHVDDKINELNDIECARFSDAFHEAWGMSCRNKICTVLFVGLMRFSQLNGNPKKNESKWSLPSK